MIDLNMQVDIAILLSHLRGVFTQPGAPELRDLFAAASLAGNRAIDDDIDGTPLDYARWAYGDADAMMAERAKTAAERNTQPHNVPLMVETLKALEERLAEDCDSAGTLYNPSGFSEHLEAIRKALGKTETEEAS